MLKDLIELDKKNFIHPTSSIQQQQEAGPKLIIEEGNGIYLKDRNGKTFIDAMSSLWNVNVGHGRKELADTASEQMQKLAYSSAFSTFSHEPRSEEHTSELQSRGHLVCRLLLEK